MESERIIRLPQNICSRSISGATMRSSRIPLKIKVCEKPNLANFVPLYMRETHKSELTYKPRNRTRKEKQIKRPTTSSEEAGLNTVRSMPATGTKSKASLWSTESFNGVLEERPKKSYLGMFQAKNGYGGKRKEGGDTTRAVRDDYSTARSTVTMDSEFADAESFVSDTSSFYNRLLDKEDQESVSTPSSGSSLATELSRKLSLTDSSIANMKSVSELSITRNPRTRKWTIKNASSKSNTCVDLNVPTMGGLGPDREATREKFLKLKKQQSYGQKVSNRNRIKMLEMQVFKNLKMELKKSNEVNKFTETILKT